MQPDELEHHMDRCRRIAGIYYKKWGWAFTHEELYSEALLGLSQAIARYNPDHEGASFKAFSNARIEGQIMDGIRDRVGRDDRFSSAKNTLFMARSLHMETDEGEEAEMDIEDPDSLNAFDQAERDHPSMGEMVQFLTKKERQIIKHVYVEELNFAEAARRMKCSFFKAKFLHDRTLEKLRFFVPRARYA